MLGQRRGERCSFSHHDQHVLCVMAHGGMGYAQEFEVERYFRESMIPRLAPVSREMIFNFIAERVLGLPKSY